LASGWLSTFWAVCRAMLVMFDKLTRSESRGDVADVGGRVGYGAAGGGYAAPGGVWSPPCHWPFSSYPASCTSRSALLGLTSQSSPPRLLVGVIKRDRRSVACLWKTFRNGGKPHCDVEGSLDLGVAASGVWSSWK
jgi:hypothetical protein